MATGVHLGLISFANRPSFNIKNNDFKGWIVDNILKPYGQGIIRRHFENATPLVVENLLKKPGFVTYRSNGNGYYMVLCKVDDTPAVIFIDKKIQSAYQQPRMIMPFTRFTEDSFSGVTIIEGEMIRPKDPESKWIFLMDDFLVKKGINLAESTPYNYRMTMLSEFFQRKHEDGGKNEQFRYIIKKFWKMDGGGVQQAHKHATNKNLEYTCRGILACNAIGKKVLFNFDDGVVVTPQRVVKGQDTFNTAAPSNPTVSVSPRITHQTKTSSAPSVPEGGTVLNVRATDIPDVYTGTCPETGQDYQLCVPSIGVSKVLYDMFKSRNAIQYISLPCKLHEGFNKMYPVV